MKKKINPNSLENLKKGKSHQFKQGDVKPKEQIEKREATKKQNRIVEETCLKWLEKNLGYSTGLLEDYLKGGNTTPETILKILQYFSDYGGQKPVERQEIIGGDLTIEVHNDSN